MSGSGVAQKRPSPAELDDFVLWGTLGIIIGGRLGYVLFYNPAYYLANPGEALAVWSGGMSFHGGFAGTVIAMILFAWRRGPCPSGPCSTSPAARLLSGSFSAAWPTS